MTPRPIAWVGTRSAEGVANLAPYSFFNVASSEPPTVLFCPQSGDDQPDKDSLANAEATGAFTVSIVSWAVAEHMNASSASVGPEVDEFGLAGVTAVDGDVVAAPYVGEAKAALECELFEVVRIGRGAVVFGTVVAFHIDDDALDGTRVLPEALDAVGRLGGPNYTRTRDIFQMARP